jgi:2-keto-4-pentenoate hydratase
MILSDLAERIRNAYDSQAISPIRELVSGQKQAYEIQEINTNYWKEKGQKIVGRKIGLTAPIVQKQLGVDEPDFGMLFDNMYIENEGNVSLSSLIQPKIEAELAFVLSKDLTGEDISIADVIAATDYVTPALEIVDSRIKEWNINICDTIADNASSALYVLGSSKTRLSSLDLQNVAMTLFEDDNKVSSGVGMDCLGSPLNSMLWLANKMVVLGRPLAAGDVVLSGAFGKMVNVKPSATYTAIFDDLGSVTVRFVK